MEGINSIDFDAISPNVSRSLRNCNFKTPLESIKEDEDEHDNTEQAVPQSTPKSTRSEKNESNLVSKVRSNANKSPVKELATKSKVKKAYPGKSVLSNTETVPVVAVNTLIKKDKNEEVDTETKRDVPVSLGTPVDCIDGKRAPETESKPFDIMNHVIAIKISGAGTLYQCQLCKRNFLRKDVLTSHGCTLQNVVSRKPISQPPPPKVPVVKYMYTRENETEAKRNNSVPYVEVKKPEVKKYRPGPKSRVGLPENNSSIPDVELKKSEIKKYKPGPKSRVILTNAQNDTNVTQMNNSNVAFHKGPSSSKEITDGRNATDDLHVSPAKIRRIQAQVAEPTSNSTAQPYPVGLFQTVPHHPSVTSNPAPFDVSEAKKRSCTVIQTSKPGKLLITTKPQLADVEVNKNGSANIATRRSSALHPLSFSLDTAARSGEYFAIINVDPLMQPSYVLPTGE